MFTFCDSSLRDVCTCLRRCVCPARQLPTWALPLIPLFSSAARTTPYLPIHDTHTCQIKAAAFLLLYHECPYTNIFCYPDSFCRVRKRKNWSHWAFNQPLLLVVSLFKKKIMFCCCSIILLSSILVCVSKISLWCWCVCIYSLNPEVTVKRHCILVTNMPPSSHHCIGSLIYTAKTTSRSYPS